MKPLTTAQREHLTRLACSAETRVTVRNSTGWNARVLAALHDAGLVVVHPGGTESRCPRSGVQVFTPGPSTVELTDAGREVVAKLVAAETARGSR